MHLLHCYFQRRNAYRVTDISPLRYNMLLYVHTRRFEHNNSFNADDSLYYNTIRIDDIRHVPYLCFSVCLVEGTHREQVQLVKVDAPEVAHVDGTLSMVNMSRIHNLKSIHGR